PGKYKSACGQNTVAQSNASRPRGCKRKQEQGVYVMSVPVFGSAVDSVGARVARLKSHYSPSLLALTASMNRRPRPRNRENERKFEDEDEDERMGVAYWFMVPMHKSRL